jgi:hypothetical protein
MYADSVHTAYRELLKNHLGSAVFISDLAKKARVSISEMRRWVNAEARPGRAILDVGHWPSATPEQRSGAIDFLGEKRLLVRFPRRSSEAAQNATGLWRKMPEVLSLFLSVLTPFPHKWFISRFLEARGVEPLFLVAMSSKIQDRFHPGGLRENTRSMRGWRCMLVSGFVIGWPVLKSSRGRLIKTKRDALVFS